MPLRRLAYLSIPLETLLEVMCGRAILTIPSDIPPDSVYTYSFVDHSDQVLKIALSNPVFPEVTPGGYIKTIKADVVLKPVPPPVVPVEAYVEAPLTKSEDWHRDI